MPALWIVGLVAVAVALLLMTRLRLSLTVKDADWSVEARATWIRYRLYPPLEKPRRKKKASKPGKPSAPKRKRDPLADAGVVLRTANRLREPLLRALGRVRGALRVEPLRAYVVYGGRDDPATAAELCGDSLALVWALMPVLERVCSIPDPRISVRVDFDAPSTLIELDVDLTLRVWALLAAGIPLLMEVGRPKT